MKQGGLLRTLALVECAAAAGLRVVIGHSFGLTLSRTCGATDGPLRPSPAAAGHWSITICPIDDVGQGPPVQIGAQIVAEEGDPPMLTHVTAARDMRGDEDALIVPEATIGFMFKLTHIDV